MRSLSIDSLGHIGTIVEYDSNVRCAWGDVAYTDRDSLIDELVICIDKGWCVR